MTRQDQRKATRGNRQGRKDPAGKDMASWKPSSEAEEAKNVEAKGDFGVPVGSGPTRERDYVTRNTKRADPGAAPPRSGADDGGEGLRTTGVGGFASGEGSSSGGDLDPDIVGVGTGGSGVAQAGPDSRIGEAATDGSSDQFASGGHAQGRKPAGAPRPGAPIRGSVVSGDLDLSTGADGQTLRQCQQPHPRG